MAAMNNKPLEKECLGSVMEDESGLFRARKDSAGLLIDLSPSSGGTGDPPKALRPTAYLDGLRGFAAFMVYWHHHQLWARDIITGDKIFERGYGYNGKYYFATLPGVRTFFSGGHFAVSIFFVISGYVLSTKPLSLVHAGERLQLADNVASALFRRWLRLFIPVICVTFVYMTLLQGFGIWTVTTNLQRSYRAELWNWYCEWKSFSYVFGGQPWLSYDMHVWSIPVEFRGSIVIYTSILAFSRARRNVRLCCEVGLVFYFIYIADGALYSMFCAGMLLCDLDLLAAKKNLPGFFYRLEPYADLIFYTFLPLSIYLGGVPCHDSKINEIRGAHGWYYLSFLKPQAVYDYKWFYLFWAATLLVASIPRLPWLKKFFETSFNQFLGRISFALYLVHGPILWLLGDRLYAATGWARSVHYLHLPGWINIYRLSSDGPLGLESSFLVPHIILLPLTLYISHIVRNVFDEPSVKFAQWLYGSSLAPRSPRTLP